ncbi:Sensors of blue-light using FAD [Polynucleobacter meluiroseus]|uniref:Sensors of blue-light using FAD n=1 Tax=Polynucleobacter meluiroseus TaxID=1938814 RepID=A0A240DZ02_9BURK|nr:BLUF domain-containing protein [Polynucleobacter meluiroseus]SNX28415.1 Sensors of blue-light using FAD [Polynucleobacter meluiroseus]
MLENGLVELSYRSVSSNDIGTLGLMRLSESSYRWNVAHQLTSVLFYENGHFGQLLEGGRSAVEELWGRIQKDPRHREIHLLGIRPITARRFPNSPLRLYDGKVFAAGIPELKVKLIDNISALDVELEKVKVALGFGENTASSA